MIVFMLILLFSPAILLISMTISYNRYAIINTFNMNEVDYTHHNKATKENTSMITKPKAKTIVYNSYNIGRSEPPKACYFGYLDGEDFNIEGPYEPEYLSWSENYDWEKRKEAKEKLKVENNNENDTFDLPELDGHTKTE